MASKWTIACGLTLTTLSLGCGSSDDANPASGGAAGAGGTAAAGGAAGSAGSGGSGGSAGSLDCKAPARDLWTWDLGVMPPADVQVAATCRGETDHAYVYVADSAWGSQVTEQQVKSVMDAFEKATPADPTRGIYAIDTETFGEPPDVDGDPHVILFYAPMADFQGYSFDGFFRADDEGSGSTSNQAEMLHLSSSGKNAVDSDYMLGVVAHELVHLIAHKYDTSEEGWLEESLAEVAMVRAGYMTDLPAAKGYVKTTHATPLCVASYSDYGATFTWGAYMLDRFGVSFVQSVLQDPSDGRASIEKHLPSGGQFRQVFGEFMLATVLDQPSIGDGRYGFASIDVSSLGSELAGQLDGSPHNSSAVAFGARALRFTPSGAGTLSVTLTSASLASLVVHSAVFDPASPGSAKVSSHDPASGAISVPVAAGEVVDFVVAVDAGNALSSSKGAPTTQFTYSATFAP